MEQELIYKTLQRCKNANNLTIFCEENFYDEETGEKREQYFVSYNYSIDGTEDGIEEYHMDLERVDSELEAYDKIQSTLLFNDKTPFTDSIAMYIKKQKEIGMRELFYVDEKYTKEMGYKTNLFVTGCKSKEGEVYLWVYEISMIEMKKWYENSTIGEDKVVNYFPKDVKDIYTYKTNDELFHENYQFKY